MGHYKKRLASQTELPLFMTAPVLQRAVWQVRCWHSQGGGWALHGEGEWVRTSFLAQENRAMIFALASCKEVAELVEKLYGLLESRRGPFSSADEDIPHRGRDVSRA